MRPLQDAQVLLLALAHVVRDLFQPGCRGSIAAMVEDTSCFLESPARGFDLGGIRSELSCTLTTPLGTATTWTRTGEGRPAF
jgi:hypothetical protein